jgi:hypothetical protein
MEDLVLFMAKGFFPLITCENIWMWMLALSLDPKLVFPFQMTLSKKILPFMVTHCVNLYVQLQLDVMPIVITTFDLWVNRCQEGTFALVVQIFISSQLAFLKLMTLYVWGWQDN